MSSPITMVRDESIEVDTSVQRKSTDTRGSSATASTPFMGPAAASRNAAFTSSAKVFFSTWGGGVWGGGVGGRQRGAVSRGAFSG
jgi:hypothetical protein